MMDPVQILREELPVILVTFSAGIALASARAFSDAGMLRADAEDRGLSSASAAASAADAQLRGSLRLITALLSAVAAGWALHP